MKTKIMILTCLLAAPTVRMAAQQPNNPEQKAVVETKGDSIIIRKGQGDMRIKVYEEQLEEGEKKEVQIFEGVYLEKVDADKRTFLDALPFIPRKKRYNSYNPHCSGVFIGYGWLSDSFFSFEASDKITLDLSKSWELGFNLLSVYHNFKKNPHWGINAGVNWGYRSFGIDGNRALLKGDEKSMLTTGDETTDYSKSRFRHFFFRIPILLEWQQRIGRSKLFFNAGPEIEIRHSVKSFSRINGGKKQTMAKGMYVRPVGIGLLAQAGYGNIGFYLRYSTQGLFQKDKGPEVSPYSFGIAWYW
ncbi:outer membrane beta-barrel protein [Bacteroides heparinolyticus]|uniref:outer membrane beta-barrel protein n=1 Tax=Prevotella heparinolytica TaxID=28113 RepID=UPI0035A05AA1